MSKEVYLGGGLTAVVMTLEEKRKAYVVTPGHLERKHTLSLCSSA